MATQPIINSIRHRIKGSADGCMDGSNIPVAANTLCICTYVVRPFSFTWLGRQLRTIERAQVDDG